MSNFSSQTIELDLGLIEDLSLLAILVHQLHLHLRKHVILLKGFFVPDRDLVRKLFDVLGFNQVLAIKLVSFVNSLG